MHFVNAMLIPQQQQQNGPSEYLSIARFSMFMNNNTHLTYPLLVSSEGYKQVVDVVVGVAEGVMVGCVRTTGTHGRLQFAVLQLVSGGCANI